MGFQRGGKIKIIFRKAGSPGKLFRFIAYAQKEGTSGYAGGWRYTPNYAQSDNSASQWPALGLGEAERAPWGISAPAWVKTRLPIWINYSQHSSGGFTYYPNYYAYNSGWVNIAKTGAGIIEMVYAGSGGNLTNAVNYIATNWGTTAYDLGNIGDHYAMYAVKKGMEYADLSTVGGHDWQQLLPARTDGPAHQPAGRTARRSVAGGTMDR